MRELNIFGQSNKDDLCESSQHLNSLRGLTGALEFEECINE